MWEIAETVKSTDLRGPPVDIWWGAGHFIHKGDGKLYFVQLRIGCISTMPCGHVPRQN